MVPSQTPFSISYQQQAHRYLFGFAPVHPPPSVSPSIMCQNYLLNITNVCHARLKEYKFQSSERASKTAWGNYAVDIHWLQGGFCLWFSSHLLSSVWLLKPFHLLWVTDVAALSSPGICPAYWAAPCVFLQRDTDKSWTKYQYPVAERRPEASLSKSHTPALVLSNPSTITLTSCAHTQAQTHIS